MNNKWHSCSTCKYYNICGGSYSNPQNDNFCKGWESKKSENVKIKDTSNTALKGIEHPINWVK